MNASVVAAQSPTPIDEAPPTASDRAPEIEAIRYAVLRKLAPGLRHALMGDLQVIQLSAELSSRMLRMNPDVNKIRETVAQLPDQCSTAAKTCRSVIEWLRPEDEATVAVDAGIMHCLKLAGDDWFLRGIEVVGERPALDVALAKAPLQELVVTALLVVTDLRDAPMDIEVDARLVGNLVEIAIAARPNERTTAFPPTSAYRKLTWADLNLIAGVHRVACVVEGDRVTLRFPAAPSSATTGD